MLFIRPAGCADVITKRKPSYDTQVSFINRLNRAMFRIKLLKWAESKSMSNIVFSRFLINAIRQHDCCADADKSLRENSLRQFYLVNRLY